MPLDMLLLDNYGRGASVIETYFHIAPQMIRVCEEYYMDREMIS